MRPRPMARKRMLAPEFFTSPVVARLPIPAMLTFAGLWVYFDDYGRGEDDDTMIKAIVWQRRRSITEKVIRQHLDAIAAEGLICRYVVGGYSLIHSPSWFEHQKISHRTDSKLPPCPKHEALLHEWFLKDDSTALERFRNGSGRRPE